MDYKLPHTIESGKGEKIIFKEIIKDPDGDKVIIEGFCAPKAGPPMHVHFKQDEGFTVKSGKAGYQLFGSEPKFLSVGESVVFPRGQYHRFWNEGEDELKIESWVKPANSIIFFLSTLYAALKNSKTDRPEPFDSAYVMVRYKNEYDMKGLPGFVKKLVIPMTYQIGKLRGKYKKFKNAPEPL